MCTTVGPRASSVKPMTMHFGESPFVERNRWGGWKNSIDAAARTQSGHAIVQIAGIDLLPVDPLGDLVWAEYRATLETACSIGSGEQIAMVSAEL